MKLAPFVLALALSNSAAISQPSPDAEKDACESLGAWAPVRLPLAGINLAIPCDDKQLADYKNANDTRRRTDGLAGCESKGSTFVVLYLVNTPAKFFDGYLSRVPEGSRQQFSVAGHRVVRSAELSDGQPHGAQLIEIDPARAVLMSTSSKTANNADFGKVTSCFFNTFSFVKS